MGGNALKEFGVSRLDQDTYLRVSTSVMTALDLAMADIGSVSSARLVPSVRNKTNHGDVDVVVPMDAFARNPGKLLKALAKHLGVENLQSTTNGDTLSFVYPDGDLGYQIDLICVKDESLDFAHSYLSWNDVSTILLRVAFARSVTVGLNGLTLLVKDGKQRLGRVVLTRDYAKAITFLGLDAELWKQGFDSLKDVYEFFSKWPGFSLGHFSTDNMTGPDVKNVLKRPGYVQFLEWIESNPSKAQRFDWQGYKANFYDRVWAAFPDALAEYEGHFTALQRKKDCHSKFNGHLVTELTGRTFKELGLFIASFKASHGSEAEFEAYVLATEQDEINADIRQHQCRSNND